MSGQQPVGSRDLEPGTWTVGGDWEIILPAITPDSPPAFYAFRRKKFPLWRRIFRRPTTVTFRPSGHQEIK